MNELYDDTWADRIDDYLDELLDAETRRRFEQAVAEDPGLSNLVQKERVLREALWRARAIDLQEKLEAWQNETPPPAGPFSRFKLFWVLIGVAAVALLALFVPMLNQKKPGHPPGNSLPVFNRDSSAQAQSDQGPMDGQTAPEQHKDQISTDQTTHPGLLAAQIRQLPRNAYTPPVLTTIRRSERVDSVMVLSNYSKAVLAYQEKNFKQALIWVQQADTARAETRQLYAHVLFQLEQYEAAAGVFQSLKNVNPFGLDAQWNTLMCFKALYPQGEGEYERLAAPIRKNPRHPLHNKLTKFEGDLSRLPH